MNRTRLIKHQANPLGTKTKIYYHAQGNCEEGRKEGTKHACSGGAAPPPSPPFFFGFKAAHYMTSYIVLTWLIALFVLAPKQIFYEINRHYLASNNTCCCEPRKTSPRTAASNRNFLGFRNNLVRHGLLCLDFVGGRFTMVSLGLFGLGLVGLRWVWAGLA